MVTNHERMLTFTRQFNLLGVREWESGQHGRRWWARAIDWDGNETVVMDHPTCVHALNALLHELSAMV